MKRKTSRIFGFLVLLIFAVFTFMPFALVLVTSLQTMTDITQNGAVAIPGELTLANFYEAWEEADFGILYRNSLAITIATVAIVLLVVVMAAYALTFLKLRGSKWIMALLIIGLMVPFEQIMLPLFADMRKMHLLNSLWGVILPQVALYIPFGIFLVEGFMQGLPYEIIESSRLDGAGEVQVLFRVILPNIRPVMTTLLIFVTMGSWNNFMLPNIMLQKSAMKTLTVGLNAFKASNSANFPLICAAALISAIPAIIIYCVFQKKITDGLLAGSVKG